LLRKDANHRLGCTSGRYGSDQVKAHDFFKCIFWKRLEAGISDPPFTPDVIIILINIEWNV